MDTVVAQMLLDAGVDIGPTSVDTDVGPDPSVRSKKRKGQRRSTVNADRPSIGPFWKEDNESAQQRRMPEFTPIAPYFDRLTGMPVRWDLPHVVVNKWCADTGRPLLPPWVYKPLSKADRMDVGKVLARVAWLRDYERKELPAQVLMPPYVPPNGTVPPRALPRDYPTITDATVRRELACLQDRSHLMLLRLEQMYGAKYPAATKSMVAAALHKEWSVCHEGLAAAMHGGLLPDLGVVLQFLPMWNKVLNAPFAHDPHIASLRRIFVKSIFQPSKVREIDRSMCNELREGRKNDKSDAGDRRRLVLLLCKLIFCSLAGYYNHARYVVGYNARRELHRWLSFSVPTIQEMRAWMLDHKLLITFVLREYHIFYIENTPGLASVFDELYDYASIRANVLHNMDRIRARFDSGVENALEMLARFRQTHPTADRIVFPGALVCDIALLGGDGSSIYYFCKKYEYIADGALLRHIFWRFTDMGTYDNVVPALPADAEKPLRDILMYWLMLKDCCRHASAKQTKTIYSQCINDVPPGEIVPPLPPKSMGRTVHRRCMANAIAVQGEIVDKFVCPCDRDDHRKCILNIVIKLVESIDVHRVIRPSASSSSLGYNCIYDRLSTEHFLARAYTACLAWCYRPRMTPFAEEMVGSFRLVCSSMADYTRTTAVPRRMRGTAELSAKFWKAKEDYNATERKKTRALIETVITSFPPSREVSIEWMMVAFGIVYDSVRAVNKARDLMMSETNRRAPYNACRSMAISAPRDFWIVRDFFKARFDYESVRAYPLSLQDASRQVASLHRRHNVVEPGTPLPPIVTTVYYCTEHRTLMTPLVGTECPKTGYINTLSVGAEGVAMDVLTGDMYCATQCHNSDRRGSTSKTNIEDAYVPPSKKVKISNRCVSKPLLTINMLGRMFQLYGKLYMLCPWCGNAMQYTRGKLTEIGIWCGCCTEGERAMAERFGVVWDEQRQCVDFDAVPDKVGDVAVKGHVCIVCGQASRRNKAVAYYLLYDDVETYSLMYIPICDRDQRNWIGSDPGTLRLSTVLRNLRARYAPGEKHKFPFDIRERMGGGM